jgi:eukaryotic-like serine/threonine-protein kinase
MMIARGGMVDSFEIKPERFGRYVLLDRIGAGGMAEVFRAVMPGVEGFQRTFVVKRILAERAQSPYFVDMFVQEARINALLHHPNIVQVFDFGNVGGTYFLAMEYVRGRDVSEILRRLRKRERPCPAGVAAFIAREVAAALAYAHTLAAPDGTAFDIVHRDISPSNIICPRTGGVKLLDFGIAKALGEPEVEKTGHGVFKGKLSYIAPERIKDLPIDGRADLFALGTVLW